MILSVKVKPNARASKLTPMDDGTWTATLRSPPADGKANEELITLVAAHFGCPKSTVSIRSGASSRSKRVEIAGR
ncbi:DUF167 domain-containing protein [soil metagenome]